MRDRRSFLVALATVAASLLAAGIQVSRHAASEDGFAAAPDVGMTLASMHEAIRSSQSPTTTASATRGISVPAVPVHVCPSDSRSWHRAITVLAREIHLEAKPARDCAVV